jgi:hypothetical protein
MDIIMKNKQTAVDFAIEQLEKLIPNGNQIAIFVIKEQAKQMEKEQIKDAFTDGCIGELYELNAYYTSEKYYEETYGTKKQDNEA